jgi:hypothetical protein
MLLFSWKKIYRKSGGMSSRIILILKTMLNTTIPKNRWDPTYKYFYEDFSGTSFLINPYDLLQNSFRWTKKEIGDYVGLASFRSLGEYRATGKKTLDLAHSPIGIDAINKNRLLRVENGEIHFYYEDYTKEK